MKKIRKTRKICLSAVMMLRLSVVCLTAVNFLVQYSFTTALAFVASVLTFVVQAVDKALSKGLSASHLLTGCHYRHPLTATSV